MEIFKHWMVFFLWAYRQHDSFLMYKLNLTWVFWWKLSSIFHVKVETFEVNQVEDFLKKKKKEKKKNRIYYFWKIDIFKWSTGVTKLKILIKIFQAWRSRNVTHEFYRKFEPLIFEWTVTVRERQISFHSVINLTLTAFFFFTVFGLISLRFSENQLGENFSFLFFFFFRDYVWEYC